MPPKPLLRVLALLWLLLAHALAAPTLFIQPRDGIQPILDAIHAAKSSIRHKIYLFTDSRQDVIEALVAAQKRGVDVKILLEREPSGSTNTAIFLRLREAGLNVQLTPRFRFVFVHEKSLVFDNNSAIISTGNITASSFSANREYQVKLDDPADVAEIARVFDADWNGEDIDLSQARLVWSPSVKTSNGLVKGNARENVLSMINNAKKSLLLEQAGMVDEEVIRALAAAQARGVAVTLVGSPADPLRDTYFVPGAERLRTAGITLRYLLTNYVHAKVIVADSERALVGSINISANSLDANRELALVLTKEKAPQALAALEQQLLADAKAGVEVNPFTLPPVEGVQPAARIAEFIGRIVTVEGLVALVERRAAVAFIQFAKGEDGARGVVFARAYDSFPQPFPDVYAGKKVRMTGRVQLYGDYYEIILDTPSQIEVLP
jgi:cardiolipin synthase A/B